MQRARGILHPGTGWSDWMNSCRMMRLSSKKASMRISMASRDRNGMWFSRPYMCFSLRRSSTWVWDSARGENKIFPLFFEMDGLRDDGFWSPSCCWGGSGIDRPEIRHSGAGHDHVPSPRDDPICRVKLYWKVWTWNRLRHVPSDWSASVLTSAWTLNRLRHVPSDWSASVLTSEAASRRPRDL